MDKSNSTQGSLVKQFVVIGGSVRASGDVAGRDAHEMVSNVLAAIMPNADPYVTHTREGQSSEYREEFTLKPDDLYIVRLRDDGRSELVDYMTKRAQVTHRGRHEHSDDRDIGETVYVEDEGGDGSSYSFTVRELNRLEKRALGLK